ncbi:biotin transporter BioY [Corynebacterium sp. HS2168-gen11]|uniref:biotin transporter BioY n=1 Tax=Corynebacterium sp. HS2168-gen11 TaxID=2974027 RepID=UPI00216AB3C1|nr:biotin transporter BioY [Corynebacterium sp. HS2168-gen11]MCS4536348.1 biotin transporter BioY [Corynebacterium sp. HS2168-gen11]
MFNSSSRVNVYDLAYIAVFAACIIVLAFVAIPVGGAGVPIVLQNAAVILAGLVLGGKRGLLVSILFLGIGMLGLPVLAGGRSTLAAIAGPTVGYLVGYIFAPLLAGTVAYLAPIGASKAKLVAFLSTGGVLGLLAQYGFGIIGLIIRAGMDLQSALVAQTPFIPIDIIKLVGVVLIAAAVHAAFPDLRAGTRTQ